MKESDETDMPDNEEGRVIESYIQKAVQAGEIKGDELNFGDKGVFWDRNTIAAAVVGVVVLVIVNMVFYYTMRIEEVDNSTQWELANRDFLIEFREGLDRQTVTAVADAEAAIADGASIAEEVAATLVEELVSEVDQVSSDFEGVVEDISSDIEETSAEVSGRLEDMVESTASQEQQIVSEEAVAIPTDHAVSQTNPVSETSEPDEVAIRGIILEWAQAWSSQNVAAYLSHYSEDFVSQGGAPFGPWSELRERRILGPEWIHVVVDGLSIFVDEDSATVEFVQVYSASNFSDESQKTMLLRKESGFWKILQELSAPIDD